MEKKLECYGKTMEKLWNFFSGDLYEPCFMDDDGFGNDGGDWQKFNDDDDDDNDNDDNEEEEEEDDNDEDDDIHSKQ